MLSAVYFCAMQARRERLSRCVSTCSTSSTQVSGKSDMMEKLPGVIILTVLCFLNPPWNTGARVKCAAYQDIPLGHICFFQWSWTFHIKGLQARYLHYLLFNLLQSVYSSATTLHWLFEWRTNSEALKHNNTNAGLSVCIKTILVFVFSLLRADLYGCRYLK